MNNLKRRIYETVMEPPEGYLLGEAVTSGILALIAINVIVGMFETVQPLHDAHPQFFYWVELISVGVFTVEYVLRVSSCTADPKYANSFRGRIKFILSPMAIIDLLAIAPFYLSAFFPVDLRFIRILRLFRLLRLFRASNLADSFEDLVVVVRSKQKELGISTAMLLLVVVVSANMMYLVEHTEPNSLFTSVPTSMWWAMMTITTIGYGDMYPTTDLGRVIGSFVGFLGICVFALPVGILGSGFTDYMKAKKLRQFEEASTEGLSASGVTLCPHCAMPLPCDTPVEAE